MHELNARINVELFRGGADHHGWLVKDSLESALRRAALAVVPPAILFFALQREFISGLTSGAVKAD